MAVNPEIIAKFSCRILRPMKKYLTPHLLRQQAETVFYPYQVMDVPAPT
jgi:hypothetical protein